MPIIDPEQRYKQREDKFIEMNVSLVAAFIATILVAVSATGIVCRIKEGRNRE